MPFRWNRDKVWRMFRFSRDNAFVFSNGHYSTSSTTVYHHRWWPNGYHVTYNGLSGSRTKKQLYFFLSPSLKPRTIYAAGRYFILRRSSTLWKTVINIAEKTKCPDISRTFYIENFNPVILIYLRETLFMQRFRASEKSTIVTQWSKKIQMRELTGLNLRSIRI